MEKKSIISLAGSLFKIQNGYLPESSYNSKTREILDRFEPKALYYCDTKYFDEEDEPYKHFDICKSYPNMLINNSEPIPIYSIHDDIETFDGIDDLEKNEEFYIDEVVLDKYGCDL